MRGMRLVLWVPVMGMALTLGGSAALADTVELNDGIVHRGKVVADSPGVVGFKTEAGKFLMIKKADIKELQKDPVAPAVPKEKEKEAAAQNSVEKEEPKPQTDWRKEYEKKLERKEMCDFVDTPLRDFARWFGGVAEVSVVVDPLCIDRKVTVNLSRTPIPLKSVLTNVMLATRCATGMFDHAIYIASSKEAIQKIQAVQLHGAKGLPPGVQERFKKPLAVDLVERPLKDVAAFLSSFGLNVFVDPAILEVPVTIKLMGDVPLAEHFVWVARVAGCGVFYQDDVIRFSRETLMVQKEDIVEKEEPGPRAEWRKEYEQKLEKKNTCSFRNTPLRDVARWFGGVAGVNVVVDPQCADRKVTVDLDRAPIPLKSMLANVVRTAQCASGMFDHAIYIASSREALQKLQAVQFQCISRLPLELQERLKRLPAEVHERLKGSRPMNWDHSTLKDVAAWLGWLAGVNVLVDPAVQEVPVTIWLGGDVSVEELFVSVARVAGCGVFYQDDTIRFCGEALMVQKADSKELKKDPVAPAEPTEKEKEAAAQNPVEKVGPEPRAEWRKEYEKKLEQKTTCDFVDTPLRDFASWFGAVAEINVVVDPLCADRPVTVNLRQAPIPLKSVLANVMLATRCASGMFDHVIYIASSKEVLQKIQVVHIEVGKEEPGPRAEWRKGYEQKLEQKTECSFRDTPSHGFALWFARVAGVNVVVDPLCADRKVTVDLSRTPIPLKSLLANVLWTTGCASGMFDHAICIASSKEALQKIQAVQFQGINRLPPEVQERLKGPMPPRRMDFVQTRFADAARWVGSLAGANVVVDHDVSKVPVTIELLGDVPVGELLVWLARVAGCTVSYKDGAIHFSGTAPDGKAKE